MSWFRLTPTTATLWLPIIYEIRDRHGCMLAPAVEKKLLAFIEEATRFGTPPTMITRCIEDHIAEGLDHGRWVKYLVA